MIGKVDLTQDGVEVKKSACYFCHQNCGVLAYVKDDKVLAIEGDPEYPTNQGGLCCRGNIALKHLDHPDRVNHPLKRVGKRGEGKWEQIPWDQAISEISAKLSSIREQHGAEAVATAGGTQRTDDWARRRFMNLFGSPNGFHNAHLCWIPTFMVETAIYGWCPFDLDIAGSKCIVLWGQNPGASGMPEAHHIADLQEKGLKVIVIDPRFTESASKADLWLPLRPGSDLALALAWIHVIIYEGLMDQEFVMEYTEGFEELAAHVVDFSPEWAAERTWLTPEQIREGAYMYAMNKPGNIQWGTSVDQIGKPAGATMHARALLRALTGNLDCPGADLLTGPSQDYLTDEELEGNHFLPEEQKAKQIGSDKFPMVTWPGYSKICELTKKTWGKVPTAEWMCEAHPPSVFRAISNSDPYPVKALLISATNPLASYGETDVVLEALRKVDFMVACDYWITPSAMFADYIMPIAGALERPIITNSYGCADFMLTAQRAIKPMYERRNDFNFWRDLGVALGQEENWPWKTVEEAYFSAIEPIGHAVSSFDEFVENVRFHFPEREYFKYKRQGFATPSGKVELYSSTLKDLGLPPLPEYVGPSENEIDNPELAEKFPLVLTTGGGFMPFHHSEHFQIKDMRFLRHAPYMDINPATAKEMSIEDGDWVWIETARGRMKQRANLSNAIHQKVIFTQRCWWYPEKDMRDFEFGGELGGALESNGNILTSTADDYCDPYSGSWANRGLLCRVYKVEEAELKEVI